MLIKDQNLNRKVLSATTYSGKLVRRDYIQAKAADAVFAISTIVKPGKKCGREHQWAKERNTGDASGDRNSDI